MKCCTECFDDEFLIEYIDDKGKLQEQCDYCESEDVTAIDPEDLRGFFEPLVGLYTPIDDFMLHEDMQSRADEHEYLWEKLTNDWGIFDDCSVAENILKDMFPRGRKGEGYLFLDSPVEIEENWVDPDDTYGKNVARLWLDFCDELKSENRFFSSFLEKGPLSEIVKSRGREISINEVFYRVRSSENMYFTKEEMGAPPKDKAVSVGRMNPRGISYLYLGDKIETCIKEVHPFLGAKLSIGEFKLQRRLKVVDFTIGLLDTPFRYGSKLRDFYDYQYFVSALLDNFSKAVTPSSAYLEYLPSQYVCEYIKSLGYDGILFKSSHDLQGSNNLTLFNGDVAECLLVEHKVVTSIGYTAD